MNKQQKQRFIVFMMTFSTTMFFAGVIYGYSLIWGG